MKYLLLLLPLFLVACGSSGKKAEKEMKDTAKAEMQKAETKKESVMAAAGDISCNLGSDTRTLQVVKNDSGCVLQYTKSGAISEVASGGVGSNHCDNVANKIKGNLVSAGFTCK